MKKYLYHKGDWKGMREELESDKWAENFGSLLQGETFEDAWVPIKSKLRYLKEKYVPTSTTKGNPTWTE